MVGDGGTNRDARLKMKEEPWASTRAAQEEETRIVRGNHGELWNFNHRQLEQGGNLGDLMGNGGPDSPGTGEWRGTAGWIVG